MSQLICALCFSHDWSDYWFCRGEVPVSSCQIKGTYEHDISLLILNLIIQLRQLVKLLQCKVTLYLNHSCCTVWKEVTMHSPLLKSGELCSTSLRARHLQKLFVILLHWGSASSISSETYLDIYTPGYYNNQIFFPCLPPSFPSPSSVRPSFLRSSLAFSLICFV